MNYVDLLAFVEETNRCPGGKRTIQKILSKTLLVGRPVKILEVGSNTGFTSIGIAKMLPQANLIGIDINGELSN